MVAGGGLDPLAFSSASALNYSNLPHGQVQDDIVKQLGLGGGCRRLLDSFNRPNISYRLAVMMREAGDEIY